LSGRTEFPILCGEGGRFVLLSGSAAIELTDSLKHVHAGAFSGTALQLELDLGKADSLSSRLSKFRDEGTQAARTFFKCAPYVRLVVA